MVWSFRGLFSRFPARNRAPVRKQPDRSTPFLAVELLEDRVIPTSGLFLQGTAFVDSNGNNQLDPSDQYLGGTNPPATIQLFQGTTLIGQTVTDANGSYLFDDSHGVFNHDLRPGTYRLVEKAPPGFASSGVQTNLSALFPASALGPDTIQVTLPDPTQITTTFDANAFFNLGLNESVDRPVQRAFVNGNPVSGAAGQIPLTLTVGGASPSTVNILSLCIDPTEPLDLGTNIYQTIPSPTPANSRGLTTYNAGRIAYLYNYFGTTPLPDADHALALQVAIWELEFDQTPDLSSGVFQFLHDSTPVTALANAYIAASAGKSEDALFLTAVPPARQGGFQSVIATGSLNFANVPVPAIGIHKTADSAAIDAGDRAGFSIIISNQGRAAATGVTLSDPLPAGAGHDVRWQIDATTGNPSDFTITGPVGSQVLTLNSSLTTLAPGASLTVHVTALTTAADVGSLANTATLHAANGPPGQQNEQSSSTITISGGNNAPGTPTPGPGSGQGPGSSAPGSGSTQGPGGTAPEVGTILSPPPTFLVPEVPAPAPEVPAPSPEEVQGLTASGPATASPLIGVFPGGFAPAGNLAFIGKPQLLSSNFLGDGADNLGTLSAFVSGLYHNLLGRDPSMGELTALVQGLLDGMISPGQAASLLWQSPEHRGLEMDYFYATFLHSPADPIGRALGVSALLSGASEQDVLVALLTSQPYLATHPSDDAFVNGVYADVLGRLPTAAEEAGVLAALRGGFLTGPGLALALAASPEAEGQTIAAFYGAFLGRLPSPTEELSLLGVLQSGEASLASVAQGLLASNEYLGRASRAI